MNAKKIVYQNPCPNIVIKNPNTGKIKKTFNLSKNRNLLSYNYSLSVNDISGNFSITFYPEYQDSNGINHSLYDEIDKLDIVEIYEVEQYFSDTFGLFKSNNLTNGKPTFIGIVKNKKYVAQASNEGGSRRLSISGYSITGLLSQFFINLDVTAQAITEQIANDKELSNELTYSMLSLTKIKDIILKIWKYFLKISSQNGTPKIAEYITRFMDSEEKFFDIDDLSVYYPLANVFFGQQTQNFYSIIDGLIPTPYYEKFAYTDNLSGKMKVKIRKSPFGNEEWNNLNCYSINADEVKSFDVNESDNEVYTVFYAYLNGYSVDERKCLILSTMDTKKDETLKTSEKYKVYGYRPLIVHFLGYGLKDGESDTTSSMGDVTEEIKEWYSNIEDMLKGSITLAMTKRNCLIQPGEKVSFLSGEFYVEGISHSWNYGSGGEVNISVSRGGNYSNGKFLGKIKDLSKLIKIFENGV